MKVDKDWKNMSPPRLCIRPRSHVTERLKCGVSDPPLLVRVRLKRSSASAVASVCVSSRGRGSEGYSLHTTFARPNVGW